MNDDLTNNIDVFRDQYFQIISDMNDDEQFNWVKNKLIHEKNEIKRLALMAVRVSILRSRKIGKKNKIVEKPKKQKKQSSINNIEEKDNTKNDWKRLRMLKSGEVNGVRFPPGIIIDVNLKDSKKLLAEGLAELVTLDKK